MSKNTTPTNREILIPDDALLVSKTDTRGIITYGNRFFIDISGYSPEELMGKQHSIVRHPDMPRGVFKLMWDTIERKNEMLAFVKNMAKDGSFYWVYATVVPVSNETGKITGYYSVRRKPSRSGVNLLSGLYGKMIQEEKRIGGKAGMERSIEIMKEYLAGQKMEYDEFIYSLQNDSQLKVAV